MVEVFVYIAVGEPFCTHIVEVVGGLQTSPSVQNVFIAAFHNSLFERVELCEAVVLQIIGLTELTLSLTG